jgi:predicted metal-dependent phosphoesterase TrpH
MRIDLHVHTRFSPSPTFGRWGASDCALAPEEAYDTLKARGMEAVTFTDHDTLAGGLALMEKRPGLPDFFLSEEVTTRYPDLPQRLHVGVFRLDEARHREIARLRGNALDLAAYCRAEGLPFALMHPGNAFIARRQEARYWELALEHFPLWEAANGSISPRHAEIVANVLARAGRLPGLIAGSDAHTRGRLAACHTVLREWTFEPDAIAGGGCSLPSQLAEVYGLILAYLREVFSPSPVRKTPEVFAFVLLFGIPMTLAGLPLGLTLLNRYNLWSLSRRTRGGLRVLSV